MKGPLTAQIIIIKNASLNIHVYNIMCMQTFVLQLFLQNSYIHRCIYSLTSKQRSPNINLPLSTVTFVQRCICTNKLKTLFQSLAFLRRLALIGRWSLTQVWLYMILRKKEIHISEIMGSFYETIHFKHCCFVTKTISKIICLPTSLLIFG